MGSKSERLQITSNPDLMSKRALSEITIHEMLAGIKDMDNTLIIKRKIKSLLIKIASGFLMSL